MSNLHPPPEPESKTHPAISGIVLTTQPEAVWVKIAHGTPEQLETPSLVLTAVGIDHLIDMKAQALMVAPKDAAAALYHWRSFREENRSWPIRPTPLPKPSSATPPTVFLMTLLALFYLHSGSWAPHNAWFLAGAIDSELILQSRQWWRLVTALTLHADAVHLAGNCVLGGIIIHLLGTIFGYGASWFLLILGGAAGNLLNILLRSQPHLSVGLSTAIFAAIGILTGGQLLRNRSQALKDFLVTLGAGAGLLAFLGSEGARTDLGAHCFGFLAGLPLGLLSQWLRLPARANQTGLQLCLFLAAMAVVLGAWLIAWHGYAGA